MSYSPRTKNKGYIKNLVTNEQVSFQFNPETFSYSKGASFTEVSSPASPYPLVSYGKGDLVTIDFVIPMFDPNNEGLIEPFIRFLDGLLPAPSTSSFTTNDPKPPMLLFCYSRFLRKCVLKNVSTDFLRYNSDGLPIHVEISISLIEIGDIYSYGVTDRPVVVIPPTPDNPEQDDDDPVIQDPTIPASKDIFLVCQAHVQNYGDQEPVIYGQPGYDPLAITYPDTQPKETTYEVNLNEDAYIGTTGKSLRLEAFRVKLVSDKYKLALVYQAHCENRGWIIPYSKNGEWVGTKGECLRLEAFKMWLTGSDADKYDVKYQAHIQDIGWVDPVRNGRFIGTVGIAKRLEAIKFRIIDRQQSSYGKISIGYQAHIQNVGWQDYVRDNTMAGTSGQALRVEALRFYIIDSDGYDLSVSAQAHCENYGWMETVQFNNDPAQENFIGTIGEGLRLEAVKITLTGSDAWRFNIFYTSYIENTGLLTTYSANGEPSGTVSYGLRLEGIKVYIKDVNDQGA